MFKRIRTKFIAALLVAASLAPVASSGLDVYAAQHPSVNYTQVEGTMLYASDETTTDCPVQISTYEKIPYSIREKITEQGCNIYLYTTNENGGGYIGGDADGQFIPGVFGVLASDPRVITTIVDPNRMVILSDWDTYYNGAVLAHEVGHFVDNHAFGGWAVHAKTFIVSTSSEWQSIYEKDKPSLGSFSASAKHNSYCSSECFAETFAIYIVYPELLKNACPDAYNYIEKVVASFD